MHLCSPSTSTMYDRFRLAYLLRVESLELSCWWSPRSWESACIVRGWMSPQTPTEGYNSVRYSGVVGWERMGTAFPHKKLSGNGVPTREILRDIFLLLLLN